MSPMLRDLQARGIIRPFPKSEARAVSPVYLVPKGGRFRFIFDAKRLNSLLGKPSHFTLPSPFKSPHVAVGDDRWGTVIDLQDGFFSCKVHPRHHKWLTFLDPVSGQSFALTRLPQGLALSPSVFCMLTREACVSLLNEFPELESADVYVDDFVVVTRGQPSEGLLLRLVQHLERLGFSVSRRKLSNWRQRFKWLGLLLDLPHNCVRVTADRILSIQRHFRQLTRTARRSHGPWLVPCRLLASLLGKLAFLAPLLPGSRMHTLALSQTLARVTAQRGWGANVVLHGPLVRQLEQAVLCLDSPRDIPLQRPLPSATLTTDASQRGWGAVLSQSGVPDRQLSGPWSHWTAPDDLRHISVLELEALTRALEVWGPHLRGRHFLWRSDSTSALAWGRRLSGPARAAPTIWKLLRLMTKFSLSFLPEHLPGVLNDTADQLSRQHQRAPADDYLFPRSMVLKLMKDNGVDLRRSLEVFSHPLTSLLPRSFSRHGKSALTHVWKTTQATPAWVFPPPALLPTVLQILRTRPEHCVLLIPHWRSRQWFHPLLQMRSGPVTFLDPRELQHVSCTWRNPFATHQPFLCFRVSS